MIELNKLILLYAVGIYVQNFAVQGEFVFYMYLLHLSDSLKYTHE